MHYRSNVNVSLWNPCLHNGKVNKAAEQLSDTLMGQMSELVKKLEAAHGGNTRLFSEPVLIGNRFSENVTPRHHDFSTKEYETSRFSFYAVSPVLGVAEAWPVGTLSERVAISPNETFYKPDFNDLFNGTAYFALASYLAIKITGDEEPTVERSSLIVFSDNIYARNNGTFYSDNCLGLIGNSEIDFYKLAQILTECQRLQTVLRNYNRLKAA
jgi:hypothetical protein